MAANKRNVLIYLTVLSYIFILLLYRKDDKHERRENRRNHGMLLAFSGSADPLCHITETEQVFPGDEAQQP